MSDLATAKQRLLEGIPRVTLLLEGTPFIYQLSRFSTAADLSRGTKVWICREDCNSGLAFGGNKVRKLEFVVQKAIDAGADTLVTTGGVQSNHMRQTAAVAAHLGMKAVLIPKDMVQPDGDPETYFSMGNIQTNSLLGARTLPLGTSQETAMTIVEASGGKPYWIPAGASQHPLGAFGYARWALQVADWQAKHNIDFEVVVAPCGGGSTLAGIILGSKIANLTWRIIGVSVFAKTASEMEENVLSIAQRASTSLGLPSGSITRDDFSIDVRFHASAYGKYDEATEHAIKVLAVNEGILLDPVYTGKAMAGLIDVFSLNQEKDNKNVLFIHTGGQPAISAYSSLR